MNICSVTETNISIYFIYRIRKILKLSARKAHKFFGMKYSSYYKLEKYDHNLPLETLFFVLYKFNLKLNHLQEVIDLVERNIERNDHLILGWTAEKNAGNEVIVSNETKKIFDLLAGGTVVDLNDVEHLDEVLGFKTVAEVDELIFNMIKESDAYKQIIKNK
ncbi:hypothetical protein RZ964_002523 [Acinetobacter baumannii]|uniref:hypothetical protein n=1 Tax=Acinetobacter calcoaceticus/baumannii complex TaxID=909768 RepID=UPI000710A0B7|nr:MULTISPECIES: hypothetical protein [Acinetobacter calcoaceticus/baumannii complex]ARD27813.1 hypothetical protein OTEC02_02845 [Acinetobacter lactucae]ELN8903578.1 hypothetical protein [Acinetobacter baumannii]ELT0787966.1 hypothetical protein [Acinetobacter baumannii]KRI29333.1 hypothetical protein APB98_14705 [Acinetobacter baumannii]MDC4769976.1 hypothetical protein [Acinetobacter baumannii]